MSEIKIEHGRFNNSDKVTDFRCRFCNMPATVWLRIPVSSNSKDAEFETFCDNHAKQIGNDLMQDLVGSKEPSDSAMRIEDAQIAHETA